MSVDISVILPVYNGEEYLLAAIESVLSQSFKNFELIVLDDGSTDDIHTIINGFDDPRLRFFSRDNRGLGATLNELIDYSTGEFIARMDADDICYPDRLQWQIDALRQNPQLVMVGGQIDFMVGLKKLPAKKMPLLHDEIVKELKRTRFPLCHPSVMFRKRSCVEIGGYRLGGAGEDMDFFLRMSEEGQVGNVPNKVLSYRMQINSLSMRRQGELNIGYAFAIYNYDLREKSLPEFTYDSYVKNVWRNRSYLKKISLFLHNKSEVYYRKYFIARSNDQYIVAFGSLFLAALLRGRLALEFAAKYLVTRVRV